MLVLICSMPSTLPSVYITPLKWHLTALTLLALMVLAVYSNTFNSPFLWDEKSYILDNPIVRDMSYFTDSAMSDGTYLEHTLKRRYMGYLSFALNYRVHGYSVTGYHIVNTAVHIITSWLVFALAWLIFNSARMQGILPKKPAFTAAFIAAALFASHPIQTEAITYIFQRLASLCAMFYLLSAVAYAASSQPHRGRARWALYIVSIIAALAAMKTKESAFTLPFALALYEFTFNRGVLKHRLMRLAPFVPMLIIVPLALGTNASKALESTGSLIVMQGAQEAHTAYEYLCTQPGVILNYLRLLVIPIGQNLDHDIALSPGITDPLTAISALIVIAMIALGTMGVIRFISDSKKTISGLVGFGITWFFMTISVESGIVPIPMLMDEYRVYLPSAGLFIAASGTLVYAADRVSASRRRAIIAITLAIPLILGIATYKRNEVWGSAISLWQDVVSKSPSKLRGYNNLGNSYRQAGMFEQAVETFEQALAPEIISRSQDREIAELYYNLATIYVGMNRHTEALERFRQSIALRPGNAEAHNNMGLSLLALHRPDEAIAAYTETLRLNPNYSHAYFNIGEAYQAMYASNGDTMLLDLATGNYLIYSKMRPKFADTWLRLSELYASAGKQQQAESARKRYNTLKSR